MNEPIILPTGKPHISFSEMSDWVMCPYYHKVKHIDRSIPDRIGPALAFGKAVHFGVDQYFTKGDVNLAEVITIIQKDYEKNKDTEMYKKYLPLKALEASYVTAGSILADVPEFFESTFPGMVYKSSESQLYEPLVKHPGTFFKGFLDLEIDVPDKKGKPLTWIIDHKTCQWGWPREKKQDANTKNQLVLYKNFWSQKSGKNIKDIRCAFVLLKKQAKPGDHCELFPVSVGDLSIQKTLQTVDSMVGSLKKGMFIKKKFSCERCELAGTRFCEGSIKV